jgi:hypothetical protein
MHYDVPATSVDAEEYCELVTSRRNMRRADDDENGMRGLIDLDLGVRYIIDENILSQHQRLPASAFLRRLVVQT